MIIRSAFLHHEGHATFHALGIDIPEELRHRQNQFATKWRASAAGRATLAQRCGDRPTAAAADSFRNATMVLPTNGALHNWLGSCLPELADLDAAIESFKTAIECDAPLAHTNLAICELRLGNTESASHHFAKAHELLPDDEVAQRNHEAYRLHASSMPVSPKPVSPEPVHPPAPAQPAR